MEITSKTRFNTDIRKEDKVSVAGLKRALATYPIGTVLKYAVGGARINDINDKVYCYVKTGNHVWTSYSSLLGFVDMKMTRTDRDILSYIERRNAKNIGVRLPS